MVRNNIIFVFFVGLLASSCSKPKLDSLIKDDSFTYHRLKMGYLLVAQPSVTPEASVSELSKLSSADLRKLTGYTVETIRAQREHLKVKPIYAHKKLTPEISNAIDRIASTKAPEKSDIEKLASVFMKFPDPYRYLFIPRLTGEKKWQDNRRYQRSQSKDVVNSEGKKVKVTEVFQHHDLMSFRQVDLNVIVLDLKFKAIVWDGLSSKSSSAANRHKWKTGAYYKYNENLYPNYPDTSSVIMPALATAIVNLPDPEDEND